MRTIAWITSKNEQFDIKDIEARKTKLNIKDLPEGLSGFKNDMGFIDRTVSNLLNYYTKNETYNREKINELVSARLLIKIVDKLPTSDISTSTIYFLKRKKEQGTTQYESDVYDEYIYVDGTWELIGNTYVDLTNYYTKSETESKIDEKVAIETQNRTLADNTLQNNIDIVQTNVDNVNNSLNSEIVTRQNKDLSHESKMSEIENNLNLETVRATNAENNLSDRCDSYDSHVANKSNPHNVTAEQVGLGNVTNVSTTNIITLDSEKNITSGAVYNALADKVDKVDGKGLSDQNFTYEEKVKLSGLSNYNDTSLSNRVSATESAITKLNANSSTSGSVDYKIAKALEGVTSISFEIVSSLPATGVAGKIYFVKGTGSEATNTYTEYVWLGSNFERIGESVVKVDLSDIYTKSQVNALVSVKNNKITIEENYNLVLTDEHTLTSIPAGENPTTGYTRKFSQVWNYIEGKADSVYAKLSHTHDKSEITNFAHNHDVMYYGKSEIDTKLAGKADVEHTHTKAQITDFPTSLPANGGTADTARIADSANALKYRGNIKNTDTFQSVMNNDGKWIITDSPGWTGSLYTFHAGGSQSGLMFRIVGGKFGSNQIQINYSVDDNKFGMHWSTLINSENIGSQTVAKAVEVLDYADASRTVKVGYTTSSVTADKLLCLAGYTEQTSSSVKLKDVSKTEAKKWLEIPTKTSELTNDSGFITSSGSITGNASTATTATNLKVSNDDNTSNNCYLIWTNGIGDGSTARGTYTSRALTYNPNSHKLVSDNIDCNDISSHFFNTESASVKNRLIIPTSAPSNLVDGSIWLA